MACEGRRLASAGELRWRGCGRSLSGVSEQSAGADKSAGTQDGAVAARLARTYLDALRAADAAGAYRVAARALGGGMPLASLYQHVIAPALHELGRLWERGAITVADEHLATALTHRVLGALRPPAFVDQAFEATADKPRAMLAAVQGEQHALGLRMVADLLEDAGYQTIYLGADVPTAALLPAIAGMAPDLLALSGTMPESAAMLEDVVVRVSDEHRELELLIGGQASTSARVKEGTVLDDLEQLESVAMGAPRVSGNTKSRGSGPKST